MFLREKEIPTFEWLKVYWGERIRLSKLSWGISGVGRVGKAWGPFLESPPDRSLTGRLGKLFLFTHQERGFNCFADNMIKLSVNKTKWTSFLARNGVCFL